MAWEIVALFAAVALVARIAVTIADVRAARGDTRRRLPRASIASAPAGVPIRVGGAVACADPVVAPYTGRPCAYARLEFLYEAGNELVRREHVVRRDFTLRDDAALAQVLVERARYEVVADMVELGRASELTPKARALLAELGWPVPAVARVELCEAVVEIGAPIDVVGVATHEPATEAAAGDERGFRDAPTAALVLSGEVAVLGPRRERRFIGGARRP